MRKFIIFLFAFCLFDFAQSMLLPFHPLLSQWVQQTIPVNKPITGIEFTDSLKGWACTGANSSNDTGYILNTINGGTNWLIQSQYTSVGFADIDMLNAQTGYAGGFLFGTGISKVYKTTNGGTNWIDLNVPNNMYVDDIFFITPESGYVCNGLFGPDVRVTTNGGQTWQIRTGGISTATTRLFFLNFNTGWVAAQFTLYRTTNSGMNWSAIGNFSEQINVEFFLNENTGWLGGVDKVFYTSNSGTNWITTGFPPLFGSITDIYFFDFNRGYGGNRSLRILITTNGGNLWGYQRDSSASFRVSFWDTSEGWTGDFGISHTTNGGGPIFYTGLVSNGSDVPSSYKLYQNYPNPFNPYTTIKLDVYREGPVSLYIYDILGKELYSILNQNLRAGSYEFNWDSRGYSSGVYICRAITKDFSQSIKMILSK